MTASLRTLLTGHLLGLSLGALSYVIFPESFDLKCIACTWWANLQSHLVELLPWVSALSGLVALSVLLSCLITEAAHLETKVIDRLQFHLTGWWMVAYGLGGMVAMALAVVFPDWYLEGYHGPTLDMIALLRCGWFDGSLAGLHWISYALAAYASVRIIRGMGL